MRKPAKTRLKLSVRWNALSALLRRGDPRRIFAGRFFKENTKIIQTARNSPRRRQKISRRPRVLVARKKRIAQATTFGIKLLLTAAGFAALTAHVLSYLSSSPRFSITHIGVHGNMHVTADTIIGHTGIVEGENIFRVSLRKSAADIEKIPQIRTAWLRKKLPDEIYIEVTERTPVALVLSHDLLYMDENARVFAQFDPSAGIEAPIITGKALSGLTLGDTVEAEGISEAIEIIKLMNKTKMAERIQISEINIDNPSNLVMVAEQSGANILLGSGDIQGKLWRLAKVVEEIHRDKRFQIANLERMDMRFNGIVPAKFKDS